ncbi:hypothetical protein [Halococcus sediminicola]|uniref:hypothetical protein n=1 Tax=Halococcus sediminicola TaxID=1264579 RepID=UPI0012AB3FD2|nr:hypothetical protein [Halococcus sediminicola]
MKENLVLAGLLIAVVAVSGCTSTTYTIDESDLENSIREINGTDFDKTCFKQGYNTAYRLRCTDSAYFQEREYTWIRCSEGEMVQWPEAVDQICSVSEYDGDLPMKQKGGDSDRSG